MTSSIRLSFTWLITGSASLLTAMVLHPVSSVADLLAIGVRSAVESCGGPDVPYRIGRVDNITPGPFGVPMPQESLQSHIASFSKMGFNKEEMIGLVACGHTIGGVHAAFSPGMKEGSIP